MLRRVLLLIVMLWPLAASAVAERDATPAQRIIAAQIAAMARDDAATAYAFAAPQIQAMFPSPEIFMSMVRNGYAPVYKPQAYDFSTDAVLADGTIRQHVELLAADGTAWTAEYLLRAGPDGSLKIIACRLAKKPEVGA